MPVTMPPCTHPALPVSIVGAPRPDGVRLQRPYATFEIRIDEDGKVTSAVLKQSTGVRAVDDASAQALRKWKFLPAAAGCGTVPSSAEYAVPVGASQQMFTDPCNHDAVVAAPVQPAFPKVPGLWRTVQVQERISLDAAGRVVDHNIIQSSGYDALDKAAVNAALESTYLPKIRGCEPTAGWYFFNVTFDPNA